MDNLQKLILNNIITNNGYCRRVAPFIKSSYFSDEYKVVYKVFLEYIGKYNSLPSKDSLLIELENSDQAVGDLFDPAVKLVQGFAKDTDTDSKWLEDTTEKWCKDRAVYLAIMDSITIINGSDANKTPDAIPDLLQKALSVSFDKSVGHDYIEDAKNRWDIYHEDLARVPFRLELFNEITGGGVVPKSLSVILAGTGSGKSLFMCDWSSYLLSIGKNVLYITLEMAEEKIAERIDANMMDVDISTLKDISKDSFQTRIGKIKSKTNGKLIIKEYPTASAHSNHFRALLNELKLKKEFHPDIIFIDYMNICASSRLKAIGGSVGSYNLVKSIAEELRGLAMEFNVPVVSATQVTRSGYASSDVELTDTSESFGVPATSDLMFALIVTEELDELEQVMVKQLKNRYNDISNHRRFLIGIDRSKMKLHDLDKSAQSGLTQQSNSTPVQSNNKPSKKGDFNGFNV